MVADLELPILASIVTDLPPTFTATPTITATPSPTATAPPTPTPTPRTFTVAAVGDVMLGREVALTTRRLDDPTWPFHYTAERLRSADLTLGNLESPIVENCWVRNHTFVLCGPSSMVAGLEYAGFDVLSLANNHRTDYDDKGIAETRQFLEQAGIAMVLDEEGAVFEVNGVRVGVMGFDDTLQYFPFERVRPAIEAMRADVEVLIVIMHWGFEYTHEPALRQQIVSDQLESVGVDVIIGAHPHWVQPVEQRENLLIFHSLGNFVFDQMWSLKTRQGEVLWLTVTIESDGSKTYDYELLPITIYDFGQPRFDDEYPPP